MRTERVAEPCSEIVAELGEGPVWDDQAEELLWVDLLAGILHRGRPGTRGIDHLETIPIDRPLGAAVPAGGGGWIIAAGSGFARLSAQGVLTPISAPEAARPELRMNDGACDPQGRFWAGSMAYDETPAAGTLYRLDADGTAAAMVRGTSVSNGLGWSGDGATMWYADSGIGTVDAFDFDGATGSIANRRTIVTIDSREGTPDGLSVDAEDCIWLAIWNGGELRRYTREGQMLDRIGVPASRTTSCCFGGDDLRTLFITSARVGLTAEQLAAQPDAGRLFQIRLDVPGVPQPRCAFPSIP